MSIAVLRTFVAKCKEEHESLVDKRNTSHEKNKLSETSSQNGDDASTGQQDEMDVVCEKELNKAEDQIDDLSKEVTKPSWKVTRELKPPLVLEVRLLIIIWMDRIRTNIYGYEYRYFFNQIQIRTQILSGVLDTDTNG